MDTASTATKKDKGPRPPVLPWENILTSLDDGVIITDIDGNVSFVNQAAENMVGLSARKMLRRTYLSILRDMTWLTDMICRSLGPEEASSRAHGEISKYRGKPIPVGAVVSPLHDPEGRTVGSVLVLHDPETSAPVPYGRCAA